MAVPNRVLVLRLHRDFEEPNVYIAILEAFQKLGYDRPTRCAKFRGGTRYFHHATDGEWQVIALCYSTLRFDSFAEICCIGLGCLAPVCQSMTVCRVSLASQPTLILSADRFQYRHEDKWSGDLGSIHVNPWNAITE